MINVDIIGVVISYYINIIMIIQKKKIMKQKSKTAFLSWSE